LQESGKTVGDLLLVKRQCQNSLFLSTRARQKDEMPWITQAFSETPVFPQNSGFYRSKGISHDLKDGSAS